MRRYNCEGVEPDGAACLVGSEQSLANPLKGERQVLEHQFCIEPQDAVASHVDLNTTQVYTQVGIRQLKAVHSARHPGAALPRPPVATCPAVGEAEAVLEEDALDDAV